MAEHKFVYTVSSKAPLSEAHKTRISQAITVAVAQALAGQSGTAERAEFFSVGRIYGGLWIDAAIHNVGEVEGILNAQEAALGARNT